MSKRVADLGDSDTGGVQNPNELVGTSLGKYPIKEFAQETNKKWIYRGYHPSLNLDICIKVLRPSWVGLKVFLDEIDNLKELHHPNIEQIFDADVDGGYHYLVSRWVEGKNLREEVESGRRFSLENVLDIAGSVLGALDYAHKEDCPHTDVKLENTILEGDNNRPLSERVCVVDFGPWDADDVTRNHVSGTAGVLRVLLDNQENPEQKIPIRLENILRIAERRDYETPGEFKDAIESYRRGVRRGINRRKFLKIGAGGLVSTSLLTGVGHSIYGHLEHINSIDYVVEQIAQTEASDHERTDPLFRELALRIFDQKIRLLVEDGKIPKGKFPYATIENGSWFLTEGGYWTEGFWPGILWQGFRITEDQQFKDWAIDWTRVIDFTERDKTTIRSIRFFYSHVKAFESTRDEFFRDQALRAAEFMASRFNKTGEFIQTAGEIVDSDIQHISIDAMTTSLPLLSWAYTETNNGSLRDIITRHCDATIQYNVNEDGSTIQGMEFDPRTMMRTRGIKSHGFGENSCLSRGQARAIKGFTTAYRAIDKIRCLEIAEKCAGYFIDNLPEDFVPFYDFKDPNENIPKDSSAAAIASSALFDLYGITGNEKYKMAAYGILKSLSSGNYLSTDLRTHQGIIMHGCANRNIGEYLNSSLTHGDYHFLEALER